MSKERAIDMSRDSIIEAIRDAWLSAHSGTDGEPVAVVVALISSDDRPGLTANVRLYGSDEGLAVAEDAIREAFETAEECDDGAESARVN
jgi:hypothetical protein